MNYKLLLLLLLFSATACEKPQKSMTDYDPETAIDSVRVQSDGSTKVFGHLISAGKQYDAEIDYVGACFTTSGNKPALTENQKIGTITNGQIIASYPDGTFDPNETYSFSVWATNNNSYFVSEPISADSLFLNITPACSLSTNYFELTGVISGNYYSTGESSMYNNSYYGSSGNYSFNIQFPAAITAGIYQTNSTATTGKVKCTFTYTYTQSYVLQSGTAVYVEKISASSFKITICDGVINYYNTPTNLSTSLIVNL